MARQRTMRTVQVGSDNLMGAFKSIYETKCALLDKIVTFGTQIVMILL